MNRPWINLIAAPLWFFITIFGFTSYFVGKGVQESDIPLNITQYTPTIILIVQVCIFLTLILSARKDNFHIFRNGWAIKDKPYTDILSGILTGGVLAALYIVILTPVQTFLQSNIGDYVPPGETMTALGQQVIPFFLANVVLAPFVEESLYRNYALTMFLEKYGTTAGIFLTSIMFGLLHWVGGGWYILMTGIFVGLPFAIITVKRKNIIWVFTAHLTLNFIEFIYISL
jgi:membrane protease YdiL (CAAX protease family)